MQPLLDTVRALAAASRCDAAEPELYSLTSDGDRMEVERLLRDGRPRFVHDTIRDQIAELLEVRDPTRKLRGAEAERAVDEHLAGLAAECYGPWVWYPWSARLVHVLPRDEYREVRSARNRYKITHEEQARLLGARVGVVGLSVGNAAVVTFALEGIGGSYRVADFDHLSLSNLNRLRGGVADLGVNKTVLAAREMYEIDPFLDIARFPHGLSPENMDAFLLEGGKLDLLVEECDDLSVKLLVRERCRALGIPVIMDTSDRGMLDVERFDREPARKILHGLIGDVSTESLRGLATKDKVPIFLDIVGGLRMSTRMAASLPEIDQSIGSWPQLASAVALGGAITADAARRMLLGELTGSGRWYVDTEAIVADGTGEFARGAPPPRPFEISAEARRPRTLPPPPAAALLSPGRPHPDAVRWIVSHAVLAPSAHNAQPWEFVWRAGVLECRHDPSHDLPTLDFEHGATWAAFGAAAENVVMAARALGLEPSLRTFPDAGDPRLVCAISFAAAEPRTDRLLEWVPKRVTNRRRDARVALDADVAAALAAAARGAGAELQLVADDDGLAELGALMGAGDRLTTMNRALHGETTGGFRWTPDEVEAHRDGLDVATLELTPAERAGVWIMGDWRIVETLKRLGGGVALEDWARQSVAASSAVGLVTVRGTAPDDYFRGGRALQRVWLEVTRRGLALQPWTGLPYLFARVERGAAAGLAPEEAAELRRLRERYRARFSAGDGRAEVLLFRLGRAGPPTAVALRRPLDRVLTIV